MAKLKAAPGNFASFALGNVPPLTAPDMGSMWGDIAQLASGAVKGIAAQKEKAAEMALKQAELAQRRQAAEAQQALAKQIQEQLQEHRESQLEEAARERQHDLDLETFRAGLRDRPDDLRAIENPDGTREWAVWDRKNDRFTRTGVGAPSSISGVEGTAAQQQSAMAGDLLEAAERGMSRLEALNPDLREEVGRAVAALDAMQNMPLNVGNVFGEISRRLGTTVLSPEAREYLIYNWDFIKEGAFTRGGQQLTATELSQTSRIYSPFIGETDNLRRASINSRRRFVAVSKARAGRARGVQERAAEQIARELGYGDLFGQGEPEPSVATALDAVAAWLAERAKKSAAKVIP